MRLEPLPLEGAYLAVLEPARDERGFFARAFCAKAFSEAGLDARVAQCSLSHNEKRGTLRGMHYQAAPHEEAKLISCPRGRIYDVLLDLRAGSRTFGKWHAVELSAETGAVYAPRGVAHGFQALTDDALVHYQISEFFEPSAARGVRWNDPAFGIRWPISDPILSEADRTRPDFKAAETR